MAARHRKSTITQRARPAMREHNSRHEHRTARVIEVIGASRESFDEAIRNALEDASQTVRGITGASVDNMTVKCDDGRVTEYKVAMKVAFGVERTQGP